MSELQTTNWSETTGLGANNAAAPDGAPEGMPPSGVNDSMRGMMVAIKRWFDRAYGLDNAGALISSAGTAPTFTVAFSNAPATLYTGFEFEFKAHAASVGSDTVNVNSLGAKAVKKATVSGLVVTAANDWIIGQHVKLKYDATANALLMMSSTAGSSYSDPLTTRGDMVTRGASSTGRLAVGAANRVLGSDGTDPSWRQITNSDCASTVYTSGTAATTSAKGVVELATSAEMVTGTDTGRVPSVSVVQNHPGIAKAWCYFDGTTTGTNAPIAGYNVSTVQRVSTGRYLITFTTPFADANYCAVALGTEQSAATHTFVGEDLLGTVVAGLFPLATANGGGAAFSPTSVRVAFFGTQ